MLLSFTVVQQPHCQMISQDELSGLCSLQNYIHPFYIKQESSQGLARQLFMFSPWSYFSTGKKSFLIALNVEQIRLRDFWKSELLLLINSFFQNPLTGSMAGYKTHSDRLTLWTWVQIALANWACGLHFYKCTVRLKSLTHFLERESKSSPELSSE